MASAEALFARNISTASKLSPTVSPKTDSSNSVKRKESPPPVSSQSKMAGFGKEVSGHEQNELSHVAFTGEDVESIPTKLWQTYGHKAKCLDLSYNRLRSLGGLENFKVLEELIMDNNELTDSSLTLPFLPHLHTITLNKNQIEDTEGLLATLEKQCPALRYLSLLGNRACPNELLQSGHDDEDYQRYRYYVLYRLPELTFLDSRAVNNEERKEAKRVGAFMQVVRPTDKIFDEPSRRKKTSEPIPSGYNPLPASRTVVGQHRGVYGQCKYVYYGKHSEGNRFIRNHHL